MEGYIIGVLFIAVNLIGFIAVGIDKYKARKKLWRIPEKNFFLFAMLGGCLGIYVGMLLFRHKTRHACFMIGIPAIFLIQLILIIYLTF